MRSDLRKKLDDLYDWLESTHRAVQRRKQVKRQLKKMPKKSISSQERSDYKAYWKQFDVNAKSYWVDLYKQPGQAMDPKYVPDDIWFSHILPYYSNMKFRRPYEDKCMHDVLFTNFKRPKTIVKRMAGVSYDPSMQIIDHQEVKRRINDQAHVIIKPSIDSGTGRLIQFYDKKKNTDQDLENILKAAGDNYICQEVLEQHDDMASLNPGSLNTIRVMSFLFEGKVEILSIICRMGAGDAKIDNVSAGGLRIGVNEAGEFFGLASDKFRRQHSFHPDTKTSFEGFKVPSFDLLIEQVKKEQKKLPHFKIIGWDFAIDKQGEPVFIEYNVCPGSNQMTCGPTFGDKTEAVMQDVFINKGLKGSMN